MNTLLIMLMPVFISTPNSSVFRLFTRSRTNYSLLLLMQMIIHAKTLYE